MYIPTILRKESVLMQIKNKEIENCKKSGDYSSLGTKTDVKNLLIESEYVQSRDDAEKWLRSNIPKEQVYQKKIMNFIKAKTDSGELNASFLWKEQSGPYQIGGLPDVMVIVKVPTEKYGRIYCFEVKRPLIGKLSPLQKSTIEKILAAGGIANVVSYEHEVDAVFRATGAYVKRGD